MTFLKAVTYRQFFISSNKLESHLGVFGFVLQKNANPI